jgi:hypothetical protein
MKILVVGGSFDTAYGKPSSVIDKIAKTFHRHSLLTINGGTLSKLKALLDGDWIVGQFDVVLWAPNVSNDEEKMLHRIKELNKKCILISTKQRRRAGEYTHGDIVGRLLKTHSNLGITFDIEKKPFKLTISDPLGNEYYSGYDVEKAGALLFNRIQYLKNGQRIGSKSVGQISNHPDIEPAFIDVIHRFGKEFTKHVNAVNPNRLLGNASTRCAKGFPAIRSENKGWYYVSRRNVDKENITNEDFVAVSNREDLVEYVGTNKPSVDTPIQVRLFNHYPNIKYMIHGHVYVKNGLETQQKVPCGYLNEFDQILKLYPDQNVTKMLINLKGHGCLMAVDSLDKFDDVEFFSRPFPEGDDMYLPAVPAEEPVPELPKPPMLVIEGASLPILGFR